jgi:Gas vesicle synthesis protein GvpL/GvpF
MKSSSSSSLATREALERNPDRNSSESCPRWRSTAAATSSPRPVARDRLDEFGSAVEELAAERLGQMRFVLHGPMPAHSFLDLQEPAWA